jgi:hypothetical protein
MALGVPTPGLAPPLGPAMSDVVPAVGPVTLISDVLGEGMLAVFEEGRLGVPVISLSG